MRSTARVIEALLLSAGAWFSAGCSDQARGTSEAPGSTQQFLGQNLGAEVEPNATSAQATVIGSDVVVRANAMPNNDVDFFRFSAEPGSRVYAATATAFSTAGDQADNDTVLDLIDPDGTTVRQTDDDNGAISTYASSIAGAPIDLRGSYYLRVRGASVAAVRQQVRPYDLHVRLRSGSPAAEAEPNDSAPTANGLPGAGWVSGTMNDGDDIDFFSLSLAAGDTVYASLDLDPERDGTSWDAVLGFGLFAGTYLYVDDSDVDSNLPSETLVATVKNAGTYYVGVAPYAAAEFGNYHLSVSVHPGTAESASCTTYTSTDVPKALTDDGRTLSTITVPGNPRLQDLDVSLQLGHARPTDLDVHLRSPAGNDNALFTDVGSASFPDINITLDDEAAFPLTPPEDYYFRYVEDTALAGLNVQPETSTEDDPNDAQSILSSGSRLAWFDGENAGGTWTLVLDDDQAGIAGSLQSWAITVCEQPARVCPNGSPLMAALSAGFESGAQGFTTSGTQNQWARGTPTGSEPFGCNGGTQCWKTNLSGDYAPSSTSNLSSPAINLTNAVAPITLEFASKYQLESATYDHAFVEVRDMAAARTLRVWEFTDATMLETVGSNDEELLETAGWGLHRIDVSSFAGRTIQLVFHLDADDSFELGGFAIDDVSVVHCGCGDSLVGPGEQCDLGGQNGQPGRCCNATCQYVANGTGCDDGSVCTTGETCTNGACSGGSTSSCGGAGGGGAGGAAGGGRGGAGNGGVAGTTAGGAGNGGVAGTTAGGAGNGGVAGTTAGGAGNGGVAGTTAGGAGNGGVAGAVAGAGGTTAGGAGRGGSAGASAGSAGNGGRAQGGTGNQGGAGEGGNGPEGGTGNSGGVGEGGEATGGASQGGSSTGTTGGASGRSGTTGGASGSNGTGEGGEGGDGEGGTKRRNAKDINADSTCGCRVPGKSNRGEVPILLALALGAAAFRRRIRR